MTASVSITYLDKLLDKLDAQKLVTPVRQDIVGKSIAAAHASLRDNLPRGPRGDASKLTATVSPMTAKVSVPRVPFVYLEAGSQYPRAAGAPKRVHRAGVKRGPLRIKARHFMSKARKVARTTIAQEIAAAKALIERRWSE